MKNSDSGPNPKEVSCRTSDPDNIIHKNWKYVLENNRINLFVNIHHV